MTRRPTAKDRDRIEMILAMRPGEWTVIVADRQQIAQAEALHRAGFGLAELKTEGSFWFWQDDRRWTFLPPVKR